MDLAAIVTLTAIVLGALLVVLTIIAVVVLGPAVRRALADREATRSEADVEAAITDPEAPHGDGAEASQR